MDTPYLTREPIMTSQKVLIGYDLRVHLAGLAEDSESDEIARTYGLVTNAFYGIGIESAVGSCFGFVNVDRKLLFDELIEALPFDDVVLRLSEIKPERDVLFRVRDLRDKGYSFAMADYRGNAYYLEPLLDQMAIIQVDVSKATSPFLESLAVDVRRPGIRLMAEQVQTTELFERAQAHGFDLFEGYHFLADSAAKAASRSVDVAALLRMLKLLKDDADSAAIVEQLKRLPDLSVATLRAANASSNALMRRTIASLPDALAMLGRDRLVRLVQILVFAGESSEFGHNPLLQLAVARAKLLEDLAGSDPTSTVVERRSAFVVGLLSLIERVLGWPLREILDELNYGTPLREALLHREGKLGVLLELAEKMERGDDAGVATILTEVPGFCAEELIKIQLGTLAWLKQSGVS